MKNLFLILTCLLCPFFLQAQKGKNNAPGYLIKKTVEVTNLERDKFYLIKSDDFSPLHQTLIRKIDGDFYLVKANKATFEKNKLYYLLEDPTWKYSQNLKSVKIKRRAPQSFIIQYSSKINRNDISESDEFNIDRKIEPSNLIIAQTTLDFINRHILNNPDVEYIDILNKTPHEESPIRQYLPEINRINVARKNFPELTGSGILISLKERSINDNDIDLAGKIILDQFSSTEYTQHAKEMGTLIAGYGNSYRTGLGVVPKAEIICTDFNSLLAESFKYYNGYSIICQNHSYGTGIENYYGVESISYDQIVLEIPELVHVFSSGNMGDSKPESGNYAGIQGYANLTGSFKQSKNSIVVGTIDSAANYSLQSSSGPAYDGRIKPEVVAFGGEGSSESAALISGCVTMLQQKYFLAHKKYPTSSLIKGLLIAGADDVHSKGIDFKTGYGSVNINRSLKLIEQGNYFEGSIKANDIVLHSIEVPNDVSELKVVLSWIDPPANPEDAIALVNDLNMTLISPSGEKFLPWILDHNPNISSLLSPPLRGEDHLNNVELITLSNPYSGIYNLELIADLSEGDAQRYSIAYYVSPKNSLAWTYPVGTDKLEAGESTFFRWDNSFSEEQGQIAIKFGESEWQDLGAVDLTARKFKYQLPDTAIYAQLRMTTSIQEFISDAFPISNPSVLYVENDCHEELILSWNKTDNTNEYALYHLLGSELKPIQQLNDTIITLDKSTYASDFYAIEPVIVNNQAGIRSYALNYKNSYKGCYINNFLAYLDIDKNANLQLTVNVPQQISEIKIVKQYKDNLETYKKFQPGLDKAFNFIDTELNPGRYLYSSELTLAYDQKIYSDTLSLYYTDKKTVIVFPNPVEDDFVSILNDYAGGSLTLLDEKGTFIRRYELLNLIDDIEFTGLKQGVYFYVISYRGKSVKSGKIIRL